MLFGGQKGFSQNYDSLYFQVFKNESLSDSVRIKAYGDFADFLTYSYPDSALEHFDTLYEFCKDAKRYDRLCAIRNSQGVCFAIQGNYAQASEYFRLAVTIAKMVKHDETLALAYNNLGNVYKDQDEFDLALEYYTSSMEIKKRMNNTIGIGNAYSNIGAVFDKMNNNDSALYYFELALKYLEEANYPKGIALAHKNISQILRDQGELQLALDHATISLGIRDSLGAVKDIASSKAAIGNIYYDMFFSSSPNQSKSECLLLAENYSKKAFDLANEHGFLLEQKISARQLYLIYSEKGKWKEALEMRNTEIALIDTLFNKENQKKILHTQFKLEFEKEKLINDIAHRKDLEKQEERAKLEEKLQNFILLAVCIGLVFVIVFAFFIFSKLKKSRKQNRIIAMQKEQVQVAYASLEEKNTEILDSITYAKRIQNAILPSSNSLEENLGNYFVLYSPKDIVAGDFYWLERQDKKVLFAAADCTGHGVPGAMVSVICNNGLNRSVREHKLSTPSEILNKTKEIVVQEFEKSDEEVMDGMDIALCSLHKNNDGTSELQYAGANNPLWIIRKDESEIMEIQANKQPIGKFSHFVPFTNHTMTLNSGDTLYIFSDGYADQFGGEKGKKLKTSNFKKLLLSISHLTMKEQHLELKKHFEIWKGPYEQLDDICVIGLRI